MARAQVAGGEDEAATETLIAMRKAHDPAWLRRALAPVGQGYRPQRALWLLLGVLALTFGLTTFGHHHGDLVAVSELAPPADASTDLLVRSRDCDETTYPCLRPMVYAMDTMVPGLDLGEANRWQPATTTGLWPTWSNLLRGALATLRLLGWGLGALFLVGAANVVVEQRRTG